MGSKLDWAPKSLSKPDVGLSTLSTLLLIFRRTWCNLRLIATGIINVHMDGDFAYRYAGGCEHPFVRAMLFAIALVLVVGLSLHPSLTARGA